MTNEKIRFGHFWYDSLDKFLKKAGVQRSTEELYYLFKKISPKTSSDDLPREIMNLLDPDICSLMRRDKDVAEAISFIALLSISPTFYVPEKKVMSLLSNYSEISFDEELWKKVGEDLNSPLFIDININLDDKFSFVLAEGLMHASVCISRVSHFLHITLEGYSMDRLVPVEENGKKVLKHNRDGGFMKFGGIVYNLWTGSFLYRHPYSKKYLKNSIKLRNFTYEGLRLGSEEFGDLCKQGLEAAETYDLLSRICGNAKGNTLKMISSDEYPYVEYVGLLISGIQIAQDVLSLYEEKETSKSKGNRTGSEVRVKKSVNDVSFSEEKYLETDMEEGLHDRYIYLDNVSLKHKRKPSSGKSHRSPRPHIVGGFWRTYKSGKHIWIESFPRGYKEENKPSREEAQKLKPASKRVYRITE